MPRGSAPGERRGGRGRGAQNKATIEKAAIARATLLNTPKKKLGKDVLEEFMFVFAGMAATYQPAPPGHGPNPNQDPALFKEYATLACWSASLLAKYQSPTFGSYRVQHQEATPKDQHPKLIEGAKVIDINDPHELSRIYRKMMSVR